MKICLVGPGIMTIPPIGWGAVEILIWEYYCELKKENIDVSIINKFRANPREQMETNSNYCQELINEINSGNYDFVHIHYDCLFHIVPFLKCKKIGLTSHYPYINNIEMMKRDGFEPIFKYMVSSPINCLNLVLAEDDMKFMIQQGCNKSTIYKLENGIDKKKFNFTTNPNKKEKTIYLGKITERKGQKKYENLKNVDIIGPGGQGLSNWKGQWTREEVFKNLTEYGNLLLLSEGEADPLVVKEALIAGLGVVINETSGKNLEANDFITIIPDNKLNDLLYIQEKIEENRKNALKQREKIREFGEEQFGWNKLLKKYLNIITNNM